MTDRRAFEDPSEVHYSGVLRAEGRDVPGFEADASGCEHGLSVHLLRRLLDHVILFNFTHQNGTNYWKMCQRDTHIIEKEHQGTAEEKRPGAGWSDVRPNE